jgi:hypothetical protein
VAIDHRFSQIDVAANTTIGGTMNAPKTTMRRLRNRAAGWAATMTIAIAPAALAAPCAGFTDVDDTSGFCANVEWLKNRAITLGCSSTTVFCPNAAVSRLAMAAFMNRLGTALTPAQFPLDVAPAAIDLARMEALDRAVAGVSHAKGQGGGSGGLNPLGRGSGPRR